MNSHYEKFADGTVKCIDEEIPFEIPMGWEWTRIRNVSQSYIGLTYSPAEVSPKGVVVLRSSNIKEGKIHFDDIVRVNKTIPDKLWVEKNDIIICARNGSKKLVGKSAIVQEVSEPMTFGAFMAICKTPLWQFVYYFLQSDLFFSQLREVSGTTTINQLTQNSFNSFLLPIPPTNEQNRISAKLQTLLLIIEKYNEQQDVLDELNGSLKLRLQKSILQEAIQGLLVRQDSSDETASVLLDRIRSEKYKLLREGKLKKKDVVESVIFKDEDNKYYEKVNGKVLDISEEIPFEIPDTWCWARIKTLYQTTSGGTPEKGHPEYYGGDIPWVKVGDLTSLYLHYASETISKLGLENSSAKVFPIGTILVAMYCNDAIGKSTILASPMATNQAICGLFPNELLYKEYVYFAIQSNKGRLQEQAAGGAQKNINQKIVNELLLPIPPFSEQKRIVQLINELYAHL